MATKRLIDANALLEKFQFRIEPHGIQGATIKECVEISRKIIQETPTVDAVEVVRCKDCKHYEIHKPKVLLNCERNGYLIPMTPDDFCSYGERKDNA